MTHPTACKRPPQAQRGFALIEALVSMLVLGGGMLGIAGFQATLSRNGDLAKQRSEATQLARDRMEELRSRAYDNVATGTDTPAATNAAYQRSWTVGGTVADPRRLITVAVSWTDRTGAAQSVRLNSIIAASNPADVGQLAVRPAFISGFHRPKDRAFEVPVAATTIGATGKSNLAWTGASGGHLLFNNTTGEIMARCTTASTTSNTTATSNSSSCTSTVAFLLTGYISGELPSSSALPTVRIDQTADLLDHECVTSAAVDQNTGAAINNYRAYTCLMTPSTSNTPRRWTGRARLVGRVAGSNLVDGDFVCRYSADVDRSGTINLNVEHPERYVDVTTTLFNQSFYLPKRGACPTGTVLHQTISNAHGGTGS